MRSSGFHGKAAGKAAGGKRPGSAVPARKPVAKPGTRPSAREATREPRVLPPASGNWREAIAGTVAGMGYELVDVERAQRGLLRITIDRIPGRAYAVPGESVTVEDCEAVTRQLQYVLEVEQLEYARLEVSSPGLDRPLKTEADFQRFAGQAVSVTLKMPFQNRKTWQGVLHAREATAESAAGWNLTFKEGKSEQVLGFQFEEVREAHLVPVVDFKGRKTPGAPAQGTGPAEADGDADAAQAVQGG